MSACDGNCYYCGPTDRELRPYGPGGATVCFDCAFETPERASATEGAFGALLDGTAVLGLTAIGTEAGPINVDAEDIARLIEQGKLIEQPPITPTENGENTHA